MPNSGTCLIIATTVLCLSAETDGLKLVTLTGSESFCSYVALHVGELSGKLVLQSVGQPVVSRTRQVLLTSLFVQDLQDTEGTTHGRLHGGLYALRINQSVLVTHLTLQL